MANENHLLIKHSKSEVNIGGFPGWVAIFFTNLTIWKKKNWSSVDNLSRKMCSQLPFYIPK
jgi:hypothetical protein